ncbi:ribbon-helix-helix protein, CopG family [Wenzhouxiangella sp. AB-CW3]|uniref:FitA-like ribbon-helix-helix domain-containing protein n=1 Tax=Wenzhouxiangella sp. AB-CW3 TaxID=2771012 RepID=UPI00168BC68B|nr:ribbon-helix-helix protein, CopG family [Wenzhouxiangella sp. AB-CW3]QOC22772.1 ribbon-helix-helix protein, CopG family [Wenzhouxiangella sp. AB-CW3]
MGSITIRRLDDDLKERLRQRAARHGRSMEDEVREVLRTTLAMEAGEPDNLAKRIQARFAPLGGVELDLPERESTREPPEF